MTADALSAAAADARAAAEQLAAAAADVRAATLEATIGPDVLIPYGTFIKSIGLSYDVARAERLAGRLKVLRVGAGKLVVRAGHAAEFARSLPLAKPSRR